MPDQRSVVHGANTSSTGIANLIRAKSDNGSRQMKNAARASDSRQLDSLVPDTSFQIRAVADDRPKVHSDTGRSCHNPRDRVFKAKRVRSDEMRKALAIATMMLAAASSQVQAQTDLTAYADANGYIDVQALTCAALAGTWQGDADRLTTWYSGWYNGLAKKHYFNIARSKELEHEVIVYCKANPQVRIIEAIAAMLKQEKLMSGFK